MDERRLRYFLAVVDEGGVTRAAEHMRVAQPSLSQALRALERELGADLFHRVGRGLTLTAAGEAFVGPARRALRDLIEARAVVTGVEQLSSGNIQVAALATLAVDPMAPLIGRFRDRYPGVRVDMLESDSADGVGELLRRGECELGAAHLPLSGEDLVSWPLGEQELLLVFAADAPGDGVPIEPQTLSEIQFVVAPGGTSTRRLLEETLASVGVTPRIGVQTEAREAIVPLVLAGAGAALLPAALAREAQRRGATIRGVTPPITRRVGLIHRRSPLSAAAHAFLSIVGAHAATQMKESRP